MFLAARSLLPTVVCTLVASYLAACSSTPPPEAVPKSPEPSTTRPSQFPPEPGQSTIEVTIYNFADHPCTYTLVPDGGELGAAPPSAVLEPDEQQLGLYPKETLHVRRLDGQFGARASIERTAVSIVVSGECSHINIRAKGYSDLELASMRTHSVRVCCSRCETETCEGCSEREDGVACEGEQGIEARLSMWNDVTHVTPAHAGLGLCMAEPGRLTGTRYHSLEAFKTNCEAPLGWCPPECELGEPNGTCRCPDEEPFRFGDPDARDAIEAKLQGN
jgi:hypothetical protein